MQVNELYIDFHVTPEEFSLPYDGILGIKILTEQKLRLDEGYLQLNNTKIALKPGHTVKTSSFNTIANSNKTQENKILKDKLESSDTMKQTFDEKIKNIPIETEIKLEFENEIEPEKLSVNKNLEKYKEANCSVSYEPKLIEKGEVEITSEITFYEDITKVLNEIPELHKEEMELQRKMLEEILTKEKAELHYETILQKNENNIKSLIGNINIALEETTR